MNYPVLIAELTGDPLGRGYAGMSDSQAAADLNTAYRTGLHTRFITFRTLITELEHRGRAAQLLDKLTENSQSNKTTSLALDMLKTYSEGGGIDISRPACRAHIDELADKTSLVIPPEWAAEIKALAETQISRAEELGLPYIDPGNIAAARS